MYLSLIVFLIIVFASFAPFTSSLITLGGLLLFMALGRTLLVSFFLGSWFAFILFLIYITGMLVLFGYMLAISPNNYYPKNSLIKKVIYFVFFFIFSVSFFNFHFSLTAIRGTSSFEEDVVKIYRAGNLSIYWFMAIVLLIALLIAVALCYKAPKPLRSFLD